MRKLLSLKLLSKTLQNPRPFAQKSPAHLSSSPSTFSSSSNKFHSISGIFSDSLYSWRSQNHIPASLLGLLTNPLPLKQMILRSHLLISLKQFSEHGVRLLRFSFQRRTFDSFDARRRSFWVHMDDRAIFFINADKLAHMTNNVTLLTFFHNSSKRSMMPTSDGMIYGLIGANVAVFFLWRNADPTFMIKNLTISIDNIKAGRLHTLITSAFSHRDGDHLITNMIGLYFFGTNIGRLFGPEFLLKLYIAGAISGSIFFMVDKWLTAPSLKGYKMADHFRSYGLGASAAVNAIILLDIFLFPKNTYYLNFFIPVPAALMGAILIGSDLWRIKKRGDNISGAAHLGGVLVAVLVWARIKKRWI